MIGGDLEFLMSSLPHLTFNDQLEYRKNIYELFRQYSGIDEQAFHPIHGLNTEASKYLSSSSYKLFESLDLKTIHTDPFRNHSNAFIAQLGSFMHQLKTDLMKWRKQRAESEIHDQELAKMLSQGNVLKTEVELLKFQWLKVEDLSSGSFTDLVSLMAYKIKLMILLRWWSFDHDAGHKLFFKLTSTE